tara:strand:- start:723 stop:1289 length:567 start_codon:yes stop_codon:yes gene_type:complete
MSRRPLGGDLAWWVFVASEFGTINLFLLVYAFNLRSEPELFAATSSFLHPTLAYVNTLLLLTSGFLLAHAIAAARGPGGPRVTRLRLLGAAALGVAFLGIKGYEFHSLADLGMVLGTSAFSSHYWIVGGFHWLHVVLGVGLLLALAKRASSLESPDDEWSTQAESYGAFWHMLDLVWVLIFALFYLAP